MNGTAKAALKADQKKRHRAELVMQVQIPMALINIILKNMCMTCFDGRQLMAKQRHQKRTKKAAWAGIGHAGSNTNGFDK